MGKTPIFAFSILIGSIIGFLVGLASRCPIHILILLTLNGMFLGYFSGMALFWKQYGVLAWGVMGVLIALIVDWVAGSSRISMLDKLAFAFAGLFIGFYFRPFRKQVLIAGCVGGILSFFWGMSAGSWFGYARLEPGLWNAILLSVKGFILGMLFGSLYMGVFGSRHVMVNSESSDTLKGV